MYYVLLCILHLPEYVIVSTVAACTIKIIIMCLLHLLHNFIYTVNFIYTFILSTLQIGQ